MTFKTVWNAPEWAAYLNVKADGTLVLVLPRVAGWCPNGKTLHFTFDATGIQQAIEAMYKHNEYVKTPFKKKKLPPNFIANVIRGKDNA